jgi:two-component system sensor kinase FixL
MSTESATQEIQALLDVAADAVIIIDHRGTIETFNRAAEKLFGYDPGEIIGSNVSRLMPEPQRALHDGYIERYLREGTAHIIGIGREIDACRKDGVVFPASLAIGQIPDSDPPRFIGFLHDLTLRRRAADVQQRMQQRISKVSHLVTMGEMAAGIAHEVNQPLAAISNFAVACERLLDAPEPDVAEVQAALRHISAQALRAGEIIRRLRDLVRTRKPRRELTDINELVRESLALTQIDASLNDVRLQVEFGARLPHADVDGIQIQQVLLNLIRNAIEALESLPEHEAREIIVRTCCRGTDEVEISVTDSGPGVHPSIVGQMFDPFRTTKEQGTGLGLAISKSLVEAHRGRLNHRPGPSRGACFVVSLPVAVQEET